VSNKITQNGILILKKEIKDWKLYIGIVIGCIISAIGLGMFLVPNTLASGGVTGAAIVINSFVPKIPVGKMSILLNIPIFIACIFILGPAFGFKSLFATILLGYLIDVFGTLPVPTNDFVLASVIGGAITGLGLGIVIRSNATTGGTDLLAKILHKFFSFLSVGQLLMVIDFVILLSAAAAFKSFELGLYAAISLYVGTKVIDSVIVGFNFSRAAYIISDYSEEIAKLILTDLDRGVTGINGKGMFSGTDKTVLLCVLRKREIPKLRRMVISVDPKAFIFLSEVGDVYGEGFHPHE